MKKDAKGITLIALVITIIVLLILATVSIVMLTGENGILKKATGAKEKNKVGEEKEIIQLAYSTLKIDEIHNFEKITKDNLKTEIEKSNYQIDSVNSDINGNDTETDDYAKITFKDTANWYIVNLKSGKIEKYGVNGEITKDEIIVGNIEIYDIEDLQKFQKLVNAGNTYKDCTVKLMNDIDLSSICGESIGNWEPIGNFCTNENLCFEGTFEGNNHTISNIYINNSNLEYQGFFGEVKNGSIKNLTTSGNIKAKRACGGIVGGIVNAPNETIEKCTNNVNVETITGNGAAGIAASIYVSKNISINNCVNNGNVKSAGTSAGGIVGSLWNPESSNNEKSNVTISNCINNGSIEATTTCSGGILGVIGYNKDVKIENCNNTKDIRANVSESGGVLGLAEYYSECTIKNSSNSGNITSESYNAGGILGDVLRNSTVNIEKAYNEGNIKVNQNDGAGGIAGGMSGTDGKSYININYAYNKGDIYAKRYCSGGILGSSYNGTEAKIENSFNEGTIDVGTSSYGGILGNISGTTTAVGKISNCHNVGTITGSKAYKGAIVGYNKGTYTGSSNYWLSTCGASYGIGSASANTNATSLTADKMKIQTNFSGWDFSTIWKMDESKGYPILQWKT